LFLLYYFGDTGRWAFPILLAALATNGGVALGNIGGRGGAAAPGPTLMGLACGMGFGTGPGVGCSGAGGCGIPWTLLPINPIRRGSVGACMPGNRKLA